MLPLLGWPPTNDSKIAFADMPLGKCCREETRHIAVEREHEHAGCPGRGGAREDRLADLVTQQLHGELRFMPVEHRSMDEQARRLVDDDDRLVAMEMMSSMGA